jgi:uncharacterized membrane protein
MRPFPRNRGVLGRLRGDRRGGVTIIMAGSLVTLLTMTALAVDVGSLYVAKRSLQGITDAAVLAAVDNPGNQTAVAQSTIASSASKSAKVVTLTPGAYTPNATLTPAARFVANATPANAATVTLGQDVPVYFSGVFTGKRTVHITTTATAARIDYAAFSIGTRLASLQGGLPNALLTALAGTNINLSVADYNSLASTNINILAFSQALGTQLNLTGLSFGQILATKATLPQVLSALASVTGDPTAAAALRSIALTVPGTTVQLSNLINLGPYASEDHAAPGSVVNVDGYSILRETLGLANGARQISLNLGATVPGVATTTLTLAVGQRMASSPWLAVAQDNSVIVHTAQARLYLDTKITAGGLVGVDLPVYVQLADAQAKLATLSCTGGVANQSASLDVLPSIGHVSIASVDTSQLSNFGAVPAENTVQMVSVLQGLNLLVVSGKTSIAIGGTAPAWQRVPFSASQIAANTVQTVSTTDAVAGIVASLVSNMKLQVSLLGLVIPLSPLAATVGAVLTPVAPVLDTLVDQLTQLLGVHLGQADVRIDGVRCGKPTLVG